MFHKVFMPNGKQLASHDAWMMMHPALAADCQFSVGDLVELEEGIFVLNEDINPMELATDKQIQEALLQPSSSDL